MKCQGLSGGVLPRPIRLVDVESVAGAGMWRSWPMGQGDFQMVMK